MINFLKSSWKWHFEREDLKMSQICDFWGMHVDLVVLKYYETDVHLFSGPCFEGITVDFPPKLSEGDRSYYVTARLLATAAVLHPRDRPAGA